MNNFSKITLLALALFTFTFTACDDDEGTGMDEQELITTVELVFVDTINLTVETFTYSDLDGAGGNAPQVDAITLDTSVNYLIEVGLYDESTAGEKKEIWVEVLAESNSHLVCYEASGVSVTIDIKDVDGNGQPLGLNAGLSTGSPATGTLTFSLKHMPDKDAADPCKTGETDVEVTFPLIVE